MRRLIIFALVLLTVSCNTEKKELDNSFYVFNNAVRTMPNAPVSVDAQAEFIKRIGFDGFAGHNTEDYFERRVAMDKVGLSMPEIYWGTDLDSTGNFSYKKGLKEIIVDSKDGDLIITLYTNAESWINNKEEGDKQFAKGLQELADFAVDYNVRIAIYPHVNNYVERVDHALKLVKLTDRKNVGAVFNTCHLLKVEGEDGWEKKLVDALPHLFIISINGSDSGNTKEMGWDKLIQPLGEGTFDIYKLVKLAKDNGYNGPFGLQCFNIKQDCEVALTKSMNTWENFKKRYAGEKK